MAQRPANVGSDLEWRDATRQCCGRAAGRAARTTRHVIGIVGRSVDGIVGLDVRDHEGHICLSPDDSAGLSNRRHESCIGAVFRARLELGIAAQGRPAFDIEAILDRHRQTGQRAKRRSLRTRIVDGGRVLLRSRKIGIDDGIDSLCDLVVAHHIGIQKLACRNLLCL